MTDCTYDAQILFELNSNDLVNDNTCMSYVLFVLCFSPDNMHSHQLRRVTLLVTYVH